LQRRYDEQYGRTEEIETQIDEVKSQIQSIRQEKISGDNIYQLLLAFDEVYGAATEIEQKEFMRAFIERIDLYPEKQKDGNWIRLRGRLLPSYDRNAVTTILRDRPDLQDLYSRNDPHTLVYYFMEGSVVFYSPDDQGEHYTFQCQTIEDE